MALYRENVAVLLTLQTQVESSSLRSHSFRHPAPQWRCSNREETEQDKSADAAESGVQLSNKTMIPVPGFPRYSITEDGRVFSHISSRFLKSTRMKNGYLRIRIYGHLGGRTFSIHELVAVAYIGEPRPGHEVNHRDGDKGNNHWRNLEWMTRRENHDHAFRMGLRPSGEKSPLCRGMTAENVRKIRAMKGCGMSQKKIGSLFGATQAQVSRIQSGKNWKYTL